MIKHRPPGFTVVNLIGCPLIKTLGAEKSTVGCFLCGSPSKHAPQQSVHALHKIAFCYLKIFKLICFSRTARLSPCYTCLDNLSSPCEFSSPKQGALGDKRLASQVWELIRLASFIVLIHNPSSSLATEGRSPISSQAEQLR